MVIEHDVWCLYKITVLSDISLADILEECNNKTVKQDLEKPL